MEVKNGIYHLFSAAIADFKRNKVRTILTSLGIMIGVLSVVMLIALGLGLKNYIKNQFESLGANLIMIMPGNMFSGEGGIEHMGPGMMGGIEFDEKDVNQLRKISLLKYITPVFFKSTTVKAGKEKESGYIFGSNEEIFPLMNLEMEIGRALTESDLRRKTKNAVLGYVVAEGLFDSFDDAIGSTIQAGKQRLTVVGVAKKKGDREMDSAVIMPYTTSFKSVNPDKTFFSIYLGINSKDDIPRAQSEAEKILLKRYEEDEFSVTEQTEILGTVNQIFDIINSVLVAIGSISLVVGGIGIMNIMYATVTERTKEIGIKRAIGATKRDILLQFLIESVVLSVSGGIIGLSLAAVIVLLMQSFFPAAINLLSVIVAFSVSTVIGVFFGVFPAKRAANLSPIGAIRYE